jgi:thiosulfate/3-mercaptopyruvate sulfurtransferase
MLTNSAPGAIAAFDAALAAEVRRLGIRPGDRVVFYEDFSGTSAARGVWLLDYAGLRGGALLDGGLSAWHAAGGELAPTTTAPIPSATAIHPDRSVLATADDLAIPSPNGPPPLPLDTRSDAEYAAGTIPGSIHVEWSRHLHPDGTLRSPTELRSLYAAAGILQDADREIAAFCASGFRAANTYVVLRALGLPRVKNYAPSWTEWGHRPDLPKPRPEMP